MKIDDLIAQIHAADGKLVLATAGAGTQAVAWLLGVAGASRTVLEIVVPYSQAAFDDFLGSAAASYVSAEMGQRLAGRALARAHALATADERILGVACTAAIATDRPKRGDHRAHITVWTAKNVVSYHLILAKGARDRTGEESIVSQLLLNCIASAYDLDAQIPIAWHEHDQLTQTTHDLSTPLQQLYEGGSDWLGVYATGKVRTSGISPELLLSGSFNPFHHGHRALAEAASAFTGKPVAFELAVFNADKPSVPAAEAARRLAQFAGYAPVYLSNAPTFIQKARLYGATTFVVGFDTAERILMPRFYADSEVKMMAALEQLQALGCRFLVAGRQTKQGEFRSADSLLVPEDFRPMFTPLPRFRVDISSTDLRNQAKSL